MHIQKRDLNEPKYEEGDHGVSSDALRFRDVIWESQEGGPDGAEHDADRVGAVHGLDGEPEDGEDGAGDDGYVGTPEAPGGTGEDGEGGVVDYACGPVQR